MYKSDLHMHTLMADFNTLSDKSTTHGFLGCNSDMEGKWRVKLQYSHFQIILTLLLNWFS